MNIHGIQSVGTLTQISGGFATLTGSFTGSFVGNGSGLTNLPTTPFDSSSLVTTASFNAYTSSTNGRLNNIESTTASLNTATSSLFASASLALVTASFNNGTRNLTFTKGDNQTFSVNIPDVSGSAGDFVTTSSFNAYTSSNDQKVNSLISATGSYAKLSGGNTFSGVQTVSDSINILGSNSLNFNSNIQGSGSQYPAVNMNVDTVTYPTDIFGGIGISDNGLATTIIQMAANSYTPEYTSQVVGWFGGGGNNASGSNTAFIMRTGSAELEIFKPISAKFDMNLNGAFTASLQQGYVWVGGASGRTTTISTGSFITESETGSFATTASFNAYTQSNDQRVSSLEAKTGSYATTGSNTFRGLQSINFTGTGQTQASQIVGNSTAVETDMYVDGGNYDTFNVLVSGSNGVQLRDYNNTLSVAQPFISVGTDAGELTLHRNTNISGNLDIQSTLTASLANGFTYVGNASGITTTVATSSFGTPIPAGTISSSAQITSLGFVSSSVTASSLVTASVSLNTITFTKGDASTFQLTVNTGSGGGGAAFPFTGDAVITGSLLVSGSGVPDVRVIGNVHITGSLVGQPITLSVASSTASLNMTAGNNFILTLPSSSTTHINATNIVPGQTLNLLIKQQIGPATGSITFAPTILFPSGLDMQATATGSAIDLVSMISFDTTNLMAANVKNLK